MPSKRLQFDRYVLDLDRGALLRDGEEIALRPKTFAVLQYLIENRGRLVSKEELFGAVWPNLVVTDDALVQCVGELRRALGDDGARLIRTIPRRGYRFEPDALDAAALGEPCVATDYAAAPPAQSKPANANALIRRALASFSIVGGLAAAAVWSGIATDWKFAGGRLEPTVAAKSAKAATKVAIAILPFSNRGEDSNREYFVDGLTQDVISALGRFSELTVMSWNAVQPYKESPASPADIASKLAVQYQVEGTVSPAGDRVRVDAQLVDAGGRVLWSGRFDEAFTDLFALQDKITVQIAGALALRVSEFERHRVLAKPVDSLHAYDYVLRARPALQRPTRAANVEARALLRRALEIDPDFAPAHAALAEHYLVAVSMGWAESPSEFLRRSEDLANKALLLDPSQARAQVTLGRIYIFYHRYDEAKAALERALAKNPNDAHALAGRGNLQMWLGETDAAIQTLELALQIDPELNAIDRFALSLAYYLKKRYDAAIEQAELNLRATENAHFSRIVLAAAYAQRDRPDDAARLTDVIRRTDPGFDPATFGDKLLNPADLERLREGIRKAGLFVEAPAATPPR
jgi:adenylate cyclase